MYFCFLVVLVLCLDCIVVDPLVTSASALLFVGSRSLTIQRSSESPIARGLRRDEMGRDDMAMMFLDI